MRHEHQAGRADGRRREREEKRGGTRGQWRFVSVSAFVEHVALWNLSSDLQVCPRPSVPGPLNLL
jgi:hypothetical protein